MRIQGYGDDYVSIYFCFNSLFFAFACYAIEPSVLRWYELTEDLPSFSVAAWQ